MPSAAPSPQQKKIYIANDDHTDYMWTTDAAGFRQAFLQMLDYYLALAESTAGEPPAYQSRFNADGTFWLLEYERNKSAAEFARLVNRIKSGHIGVPITLLTLSYGAMPAEAVLRSMYYAGELERRFGLSFKLAGAQESQTLPYGVGALLAGAGAKYLAKGICGCASRSPTPGTARTTCTGGPAPTAAAFSSSGTRCSAATPTTSAATPRPAPPPASSTISIPTPASRPATRLASSGPSATAGTT